MKKLHVNTGRPYDIIIEHNILNNSGEYIHAVAQQAQRVMIISDSNVFPLYGSTVQQSLEKAGYQVFSFVFKAGEAQKRLATIEQMYYTLCDHSFTRSDLIVALGGGVTGDMAGFAAATYLRGINFVQIPTSLLSQVDSSVGGKTGVDIPQGKNLVGAFHQPSLVLIDPTTLNSLSPHFFADGMGEVIKYGAIKSKSLFEKLASGNAKAEIDDIIYECVNIKREVVEQDEHDHGQRVLLNFGHTFGHALEKLNSYTTLSHGEGVAIGMVALTAICEKNGITAPGTAGQIAKLCSMYDLPTTTSFSVDDIVAATAGDKKSSGDTITLVTLKSIGESTTTKLEVKNLHNFCCYNDENVI